MQNKTIQFSLLVVLAILFLYAGKIFAIDKESSQAFFSNFPVVLSGIIFVFLYSTVSFFVWIGPKDIFKIVAAALYGAGLSTLLIFIAEMINLVVLFTFSRKLGRGFVESKIHGGLKRFDERIATTDYWGIFLFRLFPIIPFRFLDLGMGLTKISLKKYFLLGVIGSPLRIFVVQFFLVVGMDTVMNPQRLQEYLQANPFVYALTMAYLLGAFYSVYYMKRRGRKEL